MEEERAEHGHAERSAELLHRVEQAGTGADLNDSEVGTGSGLLNAMQQFCGALGVAVLGTLFFHWLPDNGWYDATAMISWVAVGCYGLSFLAAFLLPLKPREESFH